MRSRLLLKLVIASTTVVVPATAFSETLSDAVAAAYNTNPTLLQQRAQLRALDETYVVALAGYRPTVSLTGATTYSRTSLKSTSAETNGADLGIGLTQPLYTGGRTSAAVREAEAQIAAGRETLRSVEQQVIQQAVTAYLDVLRDEKSYQVYLEDVRVLKASLDEVSSKFDVGALTKTDVAVVRSQYALAKVNLVSADAKLKSSRSAYLAAIGHYPQALDSAPPPAGMPTSIDNAFDVAESNAPTLLAASLTEQGSRAKVSAAKAARMPSVSLGASYGAAGPISPAGSAYTRAWTVQMTATQPIYSAGQINSGIRQAVELNSSDRFGIETARRTVIQSVSSAWNSWTANQANLATTQEATTAAATALEGVREEFHAGLRTSQDIVAAETAYSNARLAYLSASHDEYIAEVALLAATGKLDVKSLGGSVTLYDPRAIFARMKNSGGVGYEPVFGALDGALNRQPALDPQSGIGRGSLKADGVDGGGSANTTIK